MERYEESYLESAEKKIESIRDRALIKVQRTHPEITVVIDHRTVDDYLEKHWDYPGQWYVGFRLPEGFCNEEALIDCIAKETIRYFSEHQKHTTRFERLKNHFRNRNT